VSGRRTIERMGQCPGKALCTDSLSMEQAARALRMRHALSMDPSMSAQRARAAGSFDGLLNADAGLVACFGGAGPQC